MQLQITPDELRPLVEQITMQVIERMIETGLDGHDGRLAFTEAEAAERLGVASHVLRDCRRRGELHGRKVGRGYVYGKAELIQFLQDGHDAQHPGGPTR